LYEFDLKFFFAPYNCWVQFFTIVQLNKLDMQRMVATRNKATKFLSNTPLNQCPTNILDNALHLMSEGHLN
jgi:hypothetical protein